ncbi:MAG TPA: nuclear transport factor 2 family protein [Steroidobacteraceae bacterium]|nr:nuclear transport factor 2 family protein [Steroidobacteraceae bacterium]
MRTTYKRRSIAAAVGAAMALLSAPTFSADSKTDHEIRALRARWETAFRAKDVNGLMALYAPGEGTVAYDMIPPLQLPDADAYRKTYEAFFSAYTGPLEVEVRDVHVISDEHIAVYFSLERIGGIIKGNHVSVWLRDTTAFRKLGGRWRIFHEHLSAPITFEGSRARIELSP